MVADHGCCWYGCCCTQVYTSGPAQVVAYRGCCCWYGHAGLQVELSGPAAPPDLYAADADTQAYRWNCQARRRWLLTMVAAAGMVTQAYRWNCQARRHLPTCTRQTWTRRPTGGTVRPGVDLRCCCAADMDTQGRTWTVKPARWLLTLVAAAGMVAGGMVGAGIAAPLDGTSTSLQLCLDIGISHTSLWQGIGNFLWRIHLYHNGVSMCWPNG